MPQSPDGQCLPYWGYGVQYDVAVGTVEEGGWVKCYERPFNDVLRAADLDCSASPLSPAPSRTAHLLFAARPACTHPSLSCANFTLLAMGVMDRGKGMGVSNPLPVDEISTSNLEEEWQSEPLAHNGVYWYRTPYVFGFSAVPQVNLQPADYMKENCEGRMSWDIEGNAGGYRAGCHCASANACTDIVDLQTALEGGTWVRAIYYMPPTR